MTAIDSENRLRVVCHERLASFQQVTHALMLSNPALFSTELEALGAAGMQPAAAALLLSVWDGERLVGAAMRPTAYPLLVSVLTARAAVSVAEVLASADVTVPGIMGVRTSATAFSDRWCAITGARPTSRLDETVYRLSELQAPPCTVGSARAAQPTDIDLLTAWLMAFQEETFGPLPANAEVAFRARATSVTDQFLLWEEDGLPLSMGRVHPITAGVARIGPIYTPPESRGRGAGTAVTAAAVQRALCSGAREVVLLADVANPTSNGIYQRLGFRAFATSSQIGFT